jgi:hypothetical protein
MHCSPEAFLRDADTCGVLGGLEHALATDAAVAAQRIGHLQQQTRPG